MLSAGSLRARCAIPGDDMGHAASRRHPAAASRRLMNAGLSARLEEAQLRATLNLDLDVLSLTR